MAACQRGVPVSVGAAVCLFAQLFLCAPGTADVWTAGQGGTAWDRLVLARESRNVEVDPEGQLQPRRVSEEQNLCLGVYDRGGWYTGVGSNLIWSGTINGAFDGNVNTAAIINAGRGRISVDLGAAYPVTRVRFYPRPSFPLRFIPGFALFANDGQSPPDLSGMDMWTLGEVTIQGTSTCRIDWQPLLERRENLEREVDLRFVPRYARYLQITDFEKATWEFAEFEVYGAGYVRDALFVSQVVDLGGTADFGAVSWQMTVDPGATVVLRTRSGSTPDPYVYYRLTGVGPGGQSRVLDANGNGTAYDEYSLLRDDKGAMVLDTDNWSYWSPPYSTALQQERMASPGPRRYVQFQLSFRAGNSFADGVRVRSLSLQYRRPPLADAVVGEIAPKVVAPGQLTAFRYALTGAFGAGHLGFDAIEIATPAQVDPATVAEVSVGGMPVDCRVETYPDRLVLLLPMRVRRALDTVRFRFECPVFVPGTAFGGTVYAQESPATGQQIRAGDAAPELDTDDLAVGWTLAGRLLGQVRVRPPVITPNGDGVNDAAAIDFAVLQLLEPATVTVAVRELGGRVVWQRSERLTSGNRTVVWPAVDERGARVPPGTYLYCIRVRGASAADLATGSLVVAY